MCVSISVNRIFSPTWWQSVLSWGILQSLIIKGCPQQAHLLITIELIFKISIKHKTTVSNIIIDDPPNCTSFIDYMPLHYYVHQDLFPEWLCKETIYLLRVGDIPLILHWQTQLCFHVISKKHHSLKSSSYKSFYIISMIFYDFALHFVYSGKD